MIIGETKTESAKKEMTEANLRLVTLSLKNTLIEACNFWT